MQLLMTADEVAADRSRWLKARLGDEATGCRVGASEIGEITGLRGARLGPRGLWLKKTGQWDDDDDVPDVVEFGNYCENFAAWLLSRDQPGWHVMPGGLYADDDLPWRVATFDRLMHGGVCDAPGGACTPASPVQLKNCAFADWRQTGVPAAYRAQVLWEASIARADAGYLVAFDRNAVKIQVIQIDMDAAARRSVEIMTTEAERFRDLVARRVPPDPDRLAVTTEALKREFADVEADAIAVLPRRLGERWLAAVAAEDAAKERRTRYLNQALALAGTAGQWYVSAPGGLVKIASRTVSPRAAHWVKATPRVDTVRPVRGAVSNGRTAS